MMFRRNNDTFCARRFCNPAPLTTIQPSRIKNGFMFCSLSPFQVGKSIGSEMDKKVILQLSIGALESACWENIDREVNIEKQQQVNIFFMSTFF